MVGYIIRGLKGRVTCKKNLNSYLDFIGSVGLVDFLIFGRRFVGEKRYPKRPTDIPTIRFPVAVDLGWASRDDIEGTIAEPVYIMYRERLPCGSFLRRLES